MATVVVRPVETETQEYRRFLTSGASAIAVVAALIVLWAVLAFVALSPAIGVGALVFAALVALFDATIATPTRLEVAPDGVTFGWWRRARLYAPDAIVVHHDVRHGRFVIRARRRVLARFSEHESGHALTRALIDAGVAITSS